MKEKQNLIDLGASHDTDLDADSDAAYHKAEDSKPDKDSVKSSPSCTEDSSSQTDHDNKVVVPDEQLVTVSVIKTGSITNTDALSDNDVEANMTASDSSSEEEVKFVAIAERSEPEVNQSQEIEKIVGSDDSQCSHERTEEADEKKKDRELTVDDINENFTNENQINLDEEPTVLQSSVGQANLDVYQLEYTADNDGEVEITQQTDEKTHQKLVLLKTAETVIFDGKDEITADTGIETRQ